MPTVEASGTVTADGSEQTLTALTLNRSYVLVVDMINLVAGDTVVLRMERRILAAGVIRTFEEVTYAGVQDPLIVSLNPLSAPFGVTVTLEQTGGVNRQFPWSVESL